MIYIARFFLRSNITLFFIDIAPGSLLYYLIVVFGLRRVLFLGLITNLRAGEKNISDSNFLSGISPLYDFIICYFVQVRRHMYKASLNHQREAGGKNQNQ